MNFEVNKHCIIAIGCSAAYPTNFAGIVDWELNKVRHMGNAPTPALSGITRDVSMLLAQPAVFTHAYMMSLFLGKFSGLQTQRLNTLARYVQQKLEVPLTRTTLSSFTISQTTKQTNKRKTTTITTKQVT